MISSSYLLVVFLFVLLSHLILGDELDILTRLEGSTVFPLSSEQEDNPCDFKEFARPNFDVPGLRISQSKCQEYIWEVKNREKFKKKKAKCSAYRLKQSNKNKKHNIAPNIIGAEDAEPGEFPHMGAVGWRAINGTWKFLCGSSLISSHFMLTAAHCSKVSSRHPNIANRSPEIVRLGDNIMASNRSTINDFIIERIIVHPQYNSPKKYFDIAIIELRHDVFFNNYIHPACLWTEFETSSLGSKAKVTGWGATETATFQKSSQLQVAVIDILDTQTCVALLWPLCNRLWCGMSDSQLCAGILSGGVDTCQGDSGGPLQVKIDLPSNSKGSMYLLIGVTSFGDGCARPNNPGVYTRISSFIDWIEDIVWYGKS